MIPADFVDVGLRLDLLILGSVAVGLAVVSLVLVALAWRFGWDAMWHWMHVPFAVLAIGLWVGFLIPFDARYHHIYRYEANVAAVSNVLTEGDGDLTRVPVVMTGDGMQIVVEDPRIVDLVGRDVAFTCSIEWVYQGADRYNCRIWSVDR